MKAITKIGLSVIGFFFLYKGAKATSAYLVSEGMSVELEYKGRVNQYGVKLTTKVNISNPTDKSMTITSPFVQLLHRGEMLSQNEVSGNKIDIKPFSKTSFLVNFQLSWSLISSLIQALKIKIPQNINVIEKSLWLYQNYAKLINSLGLKVKYSTYANGIPFSKTEDIQL